MNNKEIPKTIWFLWRSGLNEAPEVVHRCYQSWLRHNPDWNIILLDKNNINDYVSINLAEYSPVVLADILRINLLARYGGISADATCFCNKPLNDWIYDYLDNDFFAFNKPGPDRMISSWFAASSKDNYITAEYQKAVNHYWDINPGMKSFEASKWFRFNKYLQRYDTPIWFSGFVTKVLKVYPYFWFHYLFRQLYLADDKFRKLWDSTPKISADIPHKPQIKGLLNKLDPEMKHEIDNKISPVYKLTWKYDQSKNIDGTILGYILNLDKNSPLSAQRVHEDH